MSQFRSASFCPRCFIAIFIAVACSDGLSARENQPRLFTPAWMNGKRELLPSVPAEVIATMEQVWPHLLPGCTTPEAAHTVSVLGDQAVLALVWVYAKDIPESKRNDVDELHRKCDFITEAFINDSTSYPWVLPLLRERLNWVERHLDSGRIDSIFISASEIGHIEGYMNCRGTNADLRRSHDLMRKLAQSESKLGREMAVLLPDESPEGVFANKGRREVVQRDIEPYYARYRRAETALDGNQPNNRPIPTQAANRVDKAVSSPIAAQDTKKREDSGHRADWRDPTFDVLVVVLMVASTAGIVAMLRRNNLKKEARDDARQ